MISLNNVEKNYCTEAGSYSALKNITLEIPQGEFTLIMGRSGSGKSTLLNILTGVDKPSGGEVRVNGELINPLNESEMAEWRGQNIGIVFQFFQLIPTLSVIENILLPMDLVNIIPPKLRKERALELLHKVGLANHANKRPSALSGGEQQRVAIARAIANDVKILVADEPTGNLDSRNAEIIHTLFGRLQQEGKTIIMVTHEREMIQGASRKILLKDGAIIEDKTIQLEEAAI
ncbi:MULTISPECIES: ABC transporter ATP-binding protein [unclassified Paenibacillus]|uniref:ABC transporter ATP-binding protein n=1 Tax=unclassified Paenibacillus TaxID=185978 RepID=UPI0003E216E3|nr:MULTISPECIES: ABC transporter ATP-binding protein [unclassified Paenibacillus]ETT49798.1 cyclic nucleotide-binding protein [Paenibacillus sp. FSL R7-269]OMF89007.1 ABC transporter ATP-binding protein [Paenibacillus sp. FSL R7-0337]